MSKYIPSPLKYVRDQVELYERSNGTEGATMQDLPVVIITHKGCKTDAIRKTPLMTIKDGPNYVLIASQGGAPKHPFWYHNFKANPNVKLQDGSILTNMKVEEIENPKERQRLWDLSVEAYPPFHDYQQNTDRVIPVFLASPNQ
jgi:deazaflavin-dependent oxidoreductase (nitroreductase family)